MTTLLETTPATRAMRMEMTVQQQPTAGPVIRPVHAGDFAEVGRFLVETRNLYPHIDRWWEGKVIPGLTAGRRVAYALTDGGDILGLFIGKPGPRAKVCTLRLRPAVRRQGFGRRLLIRGLQTLLASQAEELYVTVSEGADRFVHGFFGHVGFSPLSVAPDRYIEGLAEYVYVCPAETLRREIGPVRQNARPQSLFPELAADEPSDDMQRLLISLKPEYAEMILDGRKTVEFRRKFSPEHEGAEAVFYVSSPVQRFVFKARVARVDQGPPEVLWRHYGASGGITRATFRDYFHGLANGQALILSDVEELEVQPSLGTVRERCVAFRPPQSFQRVSRSSPIQKLFL